MTLARYHLLIETRDLYIDPFDEVPVNSMIRHDRGFYAVSTSTVGIHLLYNVAYDQVVKVNGQNLVGTALEDALATMALEHFTRGPSVNSLDCQET
jgi:hypothetical protein